MTSINLSIISLSVSVFYYFSSYLFLSLPKSLATIKSINITYNSFAIIEAIFALMALIAGIKEKNRAAIILAALLLATSLRPFFSEIFLFVYNLH